MNTLRNILIAGAAAVAFGGLAVPALAGGSDTHIMTVQLPGGGVEQIRYSGDVAPQVVFGPASDIGFWAWDDPFAEMARISAEMDREMSGMLRQVRALSTDPTADWSGAALANLPPGTESYSVVSTMSGNSICGRSVEVTSEGPGHKPQVVTKNFGNCTAVGTASPSMLPRAAAPSETPGAVQVKSAPAHRANPYGGLVQEVSWH